MIEPFYFSEKGLFGIYHPAQGVSKRQAVVIAGPLLNEGMRAHFALRRVATELSASGFDVLRFDYEGLGNSDGDLSKIEPRDWINNLRDAVSEVTQISGENRVSIIAVRFSACLAAHVAANRDIDKILLWDPLDCGSKWLSKLDDSRELFMKRARMADSLRTSEYMGHLLSAEFASHLLKTKLPADVRAATLAVFTEGAKSESSLVGEGTSIQEFEFSCNWEEPSSQVLFPHDLVATICENVS